MNVALALINKYYHRHLALASGIAWCAGSIGGITFPFMIESLNIAYSSRGTSVVIAGIRLNLSVAGMLLRPVKKLDRPKKGTVSNEIVCLQPCSETAERSVNSVKCNPVNMIDDPPYEGKTKSEKDNSSSSCVNSSKEVNKDSREFAGSKKNDKNVDKESLEEENENIIQFCCRNTPSWVHVIINVKFLTFSVFWFCGIMGFYAIIQFMPPYLKEFGFKDQTAMLLAINGGITNIFLSLFCKVSL